jgi:hypothetical protein
MITLQTDSANIFAVTASMDGKVTASTFYFLFRFFHIETNKDYLIQLDRENIGSKRYDRFTITLPTDLNLPTGKYQYYIYQSLIDGSLIFDGLVQLETGKAWVPDQDKTNTIFEDQNAQDYSFNFS